LVEGVEPIRVQVEGVGDPKNGFWARRLLVSLTAGAGDAFHLLPRQPEDPSVILSVGIQGREEGGGTGGGRLEVFLHQGFFVLEVGSQNGQQTLEVFLGRILQDGIEGVRAHTVLLVHRIHAHRRRCLDDSSPGSGLSCCGCGPLAAGGGGEIGGGLVQGTIKGTGVILDRTDDKDDKHLLYKIRATADLLKYMVPTPTSSGSGSCCLVIVDAYSTPVIDVNHDEGWFCIKLDSFTRQKIKLTSKELGSQVIVEVDVIRKYWEYDMNKLASRIEALETKVESLEKQLSDEKAKNKEISPSKKKSKKKKAKEAATNDESNDEDDNKEEEEETPVESNDNGKKKKKKSKKTKEVKPVSDDEDDNDDDDDEGSMQSVENL